MKYEVFGTNTKKMFNMLILEILRKYSDENHPLTQQEILRLLKSEYGVEVLEPTELRKEIADIVRKMNDKYKD